MVTLTGAPAQWNMVPSPSLEPPMQPLNRVFLRIPPWCELFNSCNTCKLFHTQFAQTQAELQKQQHRSGDRGRARPRECQSRPRAD